MATDNTAIGPLDASTHSIGEPAISSRETRKVIIAASLGTVFEWYEFTLFAALAGILAKNFFAGVDPTTGFIFSLLTFAVGFMMRPFGAILFGNIGDRIGRKKTFMITVVIMGVSTISVGLLPTYQQVGILAPMLLLGLRMLQGLALGGEYGGAATYVVEQSKPSRRGFNSSWISSTGTIGLLCSFAIIYVVRSLTGTHFDDWGWRLPFIVSVVLLAISVKIRKNMHESPAFEQLKKKKQLADSPLKETFLEWKNIKRLFVALFGICGGMTCAYYVSVIYPNFFLTQTLKVDPQQVTGMMTLIVLVAIPLFALSGWVCDRIGRRPVLLLGFALGVVTLFPIFKAIANNANPALIEAQEKTPVTIHTDLASCSFMFNPIGSRTFTSECDITKQMLTQAGVSYEVVQAPGAGALTIGKDLAMPLITTAGLAQAEASERLQGFQRQLRSALNQAGYPEKADPERFNKPVVFGLLVILMIYMAMAMVPSTLMLVEMFPTRIRYTSMSFPYHFASGWIGGLLPTFMFAMSAQVGNIFFGLWYPVGWIALSLVVGFFAARETKDVNLEADY